jgi:hypothetical protein
MRWVSTREATRLTGLSTEHLREWTTRRALIPADIQRRGRGAPAQYGWSTLLVLRLAVVLRERYRIELETHRALFSQWRDAFTSTSFIGLWGRSVAIFDGTAWILLVRDEAPPEAADALIIRLDPHLRALSEGLALPGPAAAGQLELFPVHDLDAGQAVGGTPHPVAGPPMIQRRRA